MAFPFLVDCTWDDGTLAAFDSETDTASILDYPHYVTLARKNFAPWAGAHVMRVQLIDDAVAYVTETSGFDTAAAGTISWWFPVLIGADLTLTDGDTVILFSLDSAGPVSEAVVGVRNNSGVYEIFFGETGATNTYPITRSNKTWYEIEVTAVIDNVANNDGTIIAYVDGGKVGATIGSLNQGAITQARMGAVSGTALGNSGTILFGGIIADDLRIYPRRRNRFKCDKWVTQDITAFIGPGELDAVSLTGTGTNGVLNIYDTDIYEATGVNFAHGPLIYTRNVTANDQSPGMNTPIRFERGCYVQLTGTSPQAFLSLKDVCPSGVVMSDAGYVLRGQKRGERI